MPANTPNYSFNLPTDGGDNDLWGGYLNANWSQADTLINDLRTELDALKVSSQIVVGGLYFSATDLDPATTLGYGTWVAHAAGRAIVGVGDNTESVWAIDETRGEEEHFLATTEMPRHDHGNGDMATDSDSHDHNVWFENSGPDGSGSTRVLTSEGNSDGTRGTSTDTHSHNVTGQTGATGGDLAHNNIQPSIAVYIWKRTL